MGQGVSRRSTNTHSSTITFIPKTLPGEEGTARVIKRSKGVEFAELIAVSRPSDRRIAPACEHYARCSGCDYLHMSYEDEVAAKAASLRFLLRGFDLEDKDFQIIPAPERFGYRNRVQLHYRHQHLGLIDPVSDQVLEVPHCQLVSPAIKQTMDHLYGDKHWKKDHPGRGHVEIYQHPDVQDVTVAWNQPYAQGGFSQVNHVMNGKLLEWLKLHAPQQDGRKLLDLFAGTGNISDVLMQAGLSRWMLDISPWSGSREAQDYLQADLYNEETLDRFSRRSGWKTVDTLLLDPPRKGFPPLAEWSRAFKPSTILYVSCNPATLARDLQTLLSEKTKVSSRIEKIGLFDMFPGTRHFETVVILRQ